MLKVRRTYRDCKHVDALGHCTNVPDEELLAALKWAEQACEQATPEEVLVLALFDDLTFQAPKAPPARVPVPDTVPLAAVSHIVAPANSFAPAPRTARSLVQSTETRRLASFNHHHYAIMQVYTHFPYLKSQLHQPL